MVDEDHEKMQATPPHRQRVFMQQRRDPTPRARNCRVVRRRFVERHVEELPQARRIGGPSKQSPVPSPGPPSSRAVASGSSDPAPDSADRPRRHKNLAHCSSTKASMPASSRTRFRRSQNGWPALRGRSELATHIDRCHPRRRRLPIAMERSELRRIEPIGPDPGPSPQPATAIPG